MHLRHELTQQSVTTFNELKKHLNCNTNTIEAILVPIRKPDFFFFIGPLSKFHHRHIFDIPKISF